MIYPSLQNETNVVPQDTYLRSKVSEEAGVCVCGTIITCALIRARLYGRVARNKSHCLQKDLPGFQHVEDFPKMLKEARWSDGAKIQLSLMQIQHLSSPQDNHPHREA